MAYNFSKWFGKSQNRPVSEPEQKRSIDEPDENRVYQRLPPVPQQPISVESSDSAMRVAAVYRCVSILSGTIASLPMIVKRNTDGYFAPDPKNELHHLLTRRPNGRQNAFDMIQNAIIQMLNQGNAYIFIHRYFYDVRNLVLCSNNTVYYDKITNRYTISDPINQIRGTFEADQVIHLKNKSLDGGYTGVSTITYASRVFSIAASADNQSLRTFQNGSKIKGIISGVKSDTKGLGTMTDNQSTSIADRIESELNSGRDIVAVNGDAQFSQLSITPADAQLLETKKYSVFDICRFYGVHPDKAFAGQSENYKASEMSQLSFLTDTLLPILKQLEAEFNTKLIPDSVADIYKIEFDLEALYQTDLATQVAYWKGGFELGLFTTNYLRNKTGQASIDGGDEAMITCNVAPLNSAKIRGEKHELPKTAQ